MLIPQIAGIYHGNSFLSNRVSHPTPANQVHVQVEDGLTAIQTGIDDETIAAVLNIFFFSDFSRGKEDATKNQRIFRFSLVDRFNVAIWHNQDMGRANRLDVAEGGHIFVAIHDVGFGFTGDDFTEEAGHVEWFPKMKKARGQVNNKGVAHDYGAGISPYCGAQTML
jgi:hypothetical protein